MKKQAKKYLDIADEKVVKMVYAMLEVDTQKDWQDDVSDEAKASIERGLKDAEAGRVTSHKEVMKKYKKWKSQLSGVHFKFSLDFIMRYNLPHRIIGHNRGTQKSLCEILCLYVPMWFTL